MDFVNFPIVALGASLVCLIGVTLYAITQRGALRSRDEQLVVARAQAYAMLELSQAGVLFLDREHRLMGEASAAAPELLGHTCGAGTAFVQVIAELVDVTVRRETVAFLETMWHAEASAHVDATQNPLARVHSGSRHLALRFARLVVDGRVHHIIVSIERIAAPRVMPHTIEVPALNEDTFAKRLAGETGTRPALKIEPMPMVPTEMAPPEQSAAAPAPAAAAPPPPAPPPAELLPVLTGEFELGPHDVTADSVPSLPHLGNPAMATLAPAPFRARMTAAFSDGDTSARTSSMPSCRATASAVVRLSPVSITSFSPSACSARMASAAVVLMGSAIAIKPAARPSIATNTTVSPFRRRSSAACVRCASEAPRRCINSAFPTPTLRPPISAVKP